jgi:hypothetical protein
MVKIDVNKDIIIIFDEKNKTATVIDKGVINERIAEIYGRLAEINIVKDKDLLDWAKKNYPTPEIAEERSRLEKELDGLLIKSNM